ncbi:MAG: MFS transporter [Actinomycetota bacterium]|jgi:predicted MFS family arabinose efflux permease|nr:MFS transporter [Actinomycetota bacterium]
MSSTEQRLNPSLVVVMASAIGIIVANLYYLQPLLHEVRSGFRVSTASTSLLITLIQTGYLIGLFFIVPLGDLFVRRNLIVSVFLLAALTMAAASFVHSFALFAALTVVIGLTSVAGQIIIPFGADLAPDAQRGRVIGQLMTGLLGGVLLSRTLSGAISEAIGWRGVYLVSSGLLVVTGGVLFFVLPQERPRDRFEYRHLLTGGFSLLRRTPQLRRRAWFGAAAFGAFSVLWSTLAFHLSGAPFHYSSGVIGLFGLFGMAGIVAANGAGRLADQGRSALATRSSAVLIAVGFVVLFLGRTDVWTLVAGTIILDAGTQGIHVSNQSIIYALAPSQRSTVNSIYMVCYFAGAALGSLLSGTAFARFGWNGTCVVGGAFALATIVPAYAWREATNTRPTSPVRERSRRS